MTTAASISPPSPGTYRFIVGSAAEAVETICARLGSAARVVSVQSQARTGLGRWVGARRFEVVAELPSPAAQPAEDPAPASNPAGVSDGGPRENFSAAVAGDTTLGVLLRRAGFSERLLGRIEASPNWQTMSGRPLPQALAEFGRELRARLAARPPRPLPARVAFLGAPGAGRTTALGKWLAREVCARAARGQVWKVEFDRPNPTPALEVLCEALGVPFAHYAPGATAEEEEFLLVDLPGLEPEGSAGARATREFLARERIAGRVLVLNAAYDLDALRAARERARGLGATHLVLTHLDESARWGRLWEFLMEDDLSPLFLSTGPGFSGDIETEAVGAVLRRTLPGA